MVIRIQGQETLWEAKLAKPSAFTSDQTQAGANHRRKQLEALHRNKPSNVKGGQKLQSCTWENAEEV